MATGRVPTTANSPLTTKGDLFGYSTTQARVAVGSDGDTLVADSAATTGLRWQSTPSASNPVINGGYDIWQRATSFSLAANSGVTFTADRYSTATGSNEACTIGRQATSDTTNLPFIQYCYRWQRNSGQTGTAEMTLVNHFETVNSIPFAGKTVTYSFYARKGADFSGTIQAVLWTGTGTDQTIWTGLTNQAKPIETAFTTTTTWQRFSFTVTLSSSITQIAVGFEWTPSGTAGAADYVELTGLQMDVGSVGLPFRRSGNTLQGELAACQRYYQVLNGSLAGYSPTSEAMANYYRHLVQTRVSPTVTITTNPTYTNSSGLTNDENSTTGSRFYVTPTATGRVFATGFVYTLAAEL